MTLSTGLSLIPLSKVQDKTGLKHSKIYDSIADETFPPGVKISSRCARWVESEIDAVIHSMIAGATPDQLRQLVRSLVEKRRTTALMVGVPREKQHPEPSAAA